MRDISSIAYNALNLYTFQLRNKEGTKTFKEPSDISIITVERYIYFMPGQNCSVGH